MFRHKSTRLAALMTVSILPLLLTQVGTTTALAQSKQNAQQTTTYAFNIGSQTLEEALNDFTDATGVQHFFSDPNIFTARSSGVSGNMSVDNALGHMLDGTGFSYSFSDNNTVVIRKEDEDGDQPADDSSGDAEPDDDEGASDMVLDEIFVTGSRIQRSTATTPVPVTSLDSEQFALNGDARVAQTLTQLPSIGSTTSPANTNFNPQDAGTNFLDLRRLGSDRTLTLLNGRRHVGSRPGSAAVDTNVIPSALVERVEVITGGASAVYGADAVSGVINIITKDDFEGLQFDGQVGTSNEGDGETYQISITGGMNFNDDRGNMYFNTTFDRSEDINGSDRDWRLQKLRFATNPADTGPSDGIPGQILFGDTGFISTPPGGRPIGPNGELLEAHGGPFTFDANGNLQTQELGTLVESFLSSGGQTADLAPYDLLQVPVERLLVSGGMTYELTEKLNFFVRGKFSQTQSSTAGQTTFSIPSFAPILLSVDNPFVPQELRDILNTEGIDEFFVGRTNVDQGQARSKSDRNTVQIYAGFEGELNSNIDYTIHYQYGRSDNTTEYINQQVPSRYNQALDAVIDGDTGDIVCRDQSNGCVPLNVLGTQAATPEALAFVHADYLSRGDLEQQVINATISGDTAGQFEPLAGPIGFAFGAEYRKEEANTEEGFLRNAGDIFGSPPIGDIDGKFNVWEVFGEVRIPLLVDQPFAKEANLEAAVRIGDYSTIGSTTAWKVSGDWAPSDDIRLRGTISVAVRAPNIGELFGPTNVAFIFLEDPCDAGNLDSGSATRRANCAALGIPTDFASQSLNRNNTVITGGNPDLLEEKADTYTVGAILTPQWIPGLTVAVDYWDIKISNAINNFPAQALVRNCVDSETINNPFCAQITRQANHNFDLIESRLINVAAFEASGIDFDATYYVDLGESGDLKLNAVATYLSKLSFFAQEETETPDREAGEMGDPKFLMNLRATYIYDRFTFSMEGRYISSQKFDLGESEEVRDPNSTGSEWYADIHARYKIRDNVTIWGGVDNLFNNTPPLLARIPEIRSFTGDSTVYDQIGRYFRLGVSANF